MLGTEDWKNTTQNIISKQIGRDKYSIYIGPEYMAIIQISKIKVRSGSVSDLPQLSDGEFGWADDERRLFIGNGSNISGDTTPNNSEIPTIVQGTLLSNGISTVDFSDVSNVFLGNITNVHLTGGTSGQYLQTDGAGNLVWADGSNSTAGNGSPAGSQYQIQFKSSGASFAASAYFTYNPGAGNGYQGILTAPILSVGEIRTSSGSMNISSPLVVSSNATFTGASVDLGNISNLHITGGSNGFVLTTDGNANLSWSNIANLLSGAAISNTSVNATSLTSYTANLGNGLFTVGLPGNVIGISNSTQQFNISAGNTNFLGNNVNFGNSTSGPNISFLNCNISLSNSPITSNSNVTINAPGVLTANTANINYLNASNANISNATVGLLTVTGNASIAGNLTVSTDLIVLGNIRAKGSNTQVQYNNAGNIAGDANLTFDGTKLTTRAANITSNLQTASLGVGASASGTAGEIVATGNIIAFFSDDRLKTRLGNIENALDKIDTLSTFYYEPNDTAVELGYTKFRDVGVSAQEVQSILPEIVVDAPISNNYLTIKYDKLTPLLIAAVKELRQEVNELKKRL